MFLLDYFPPIAFIVVTIGTYLILARSKDNS